MSNKFISVTIR